MLSIVVGNNTWDLVNFSRDEAVISNFVDKSKTMPSCNVSDRKRSSDVITDEARPDGVNGLVHKKLPCVKAVVIALDTEQSIFSASSMLLRKMEAFSKLVDLKKATASEFGTVSVTSPVLEATKIMFWY